MDQSEALIPERLARHMVA